MMNSLIELPHVNVYRFPFNQRQAANKYFQRAHNVETTSIQGRQFALNVILPSGKIRKKKYFKISSTEIFTNMLKVNVSLFSVKLMLCEIVVYRKNKCLVKVHLPINIYDRLIYVLWNL